MTELLKCPFCGGVARIQEKLVQFEDVVALEYGFRCWKCGCMKTGYPTRERAIEAWNTRKPVEDVMGKLNDLYNFYDSEKKEAYYEKDWEVFDRSMNINRGIYEAMAIFEKGFRND